MPSTSHSFADTLGERLNTTVLDDHDVEAAWSTLHKTAFKCLGPSTRKHKDWFDENCTEITQLLEDKRRAYKAHIDDPNSTARKDALRNACSTVQQKLREMQDSWLNAKADEIQRYADSHDMKNFYSGLKEVHGPISSGFYPLLSADVSTLITEKEKILDRWAENFNGVLNRPSTINDEAIDQLPQVPTDESMDVVSSSEEIQKAIRLLSSGKSTWYRLHPS